MSSYELPTSTAIPHHADRLTTRRDFAGLHRDTWAVIRSNLAVYVGLPTVLLLPFDLLADAASTSLGSDFAGLYIALSIVGSYGGMIISTLIPAVVLHALKEGMRGRKVGVGEALRGGFRQWGAVFSAMFAAGVYALLGFLLFFVPGLIAMARASLAPVVAAFEGQTGTHALDRSIALTVQRGVGRILVWGLSAYSIYTVLSLLSTLGFTALHSTLELPVPTLLSALATIPANLLAVGMLVGTAVIYVDTIDARASYPLGRELSKDDGTRIPAPAGSGTRGLVIAALIAGCSLPAVAGLVTYAFEEDAETVATADEGDEGTTDGDMFDAMIEELEAENAASGGS